MTSMNANNIDDILPKFVRELVKLLAGKFSQILGGIDLP
jgi:hypothetical protein